MISDDYTGPERRRRNLTQDDREWIKRAIIEHHKCPFDEQDVTAVKKVVDIIRTLGDDNLNRGIERFREQNHFLSGFISRKSVIIGAAILSITGLAAVSFIRFLAVAIRDAVILK